MFDDTRPIFLQLAERIEGDILRGAYGEGEQVPSTNELAAYLRINPATAGKALGLLVEREILVKRRGIGMFVAAGAKERISADRRRSFVRDYVQPLLAEARALGIDRAELTRLLETPVGPADSAGPADPPGPTPATPATASGSATPVGPPET